MRHARGMALLLTLVALVVVTSATVTLVRMVLTDRTRVRRDAETVLAGDLLRASERPILKWLTTRSESVVLPADADEPRVLVLDDAWTVGETPFELRLTAFDQAGMISIAAARTGSPLRPLLPAGFRRELDELAEPPARRFGLDLLPGSPFPSGGDQPGAAGITPGALVATHFDDPAWLNVHTAPLSLIRAVYRLAGTGGVELIEKARTEGKNVGALPPPSEQAKAESLPRLATRSDGWAFRIDLRVGAVRRSFWAVYRRAPEAEWSCVQRLLIHD